VADYIDRLPHEGVAPGAGTEQTSLVVGAMRAGTVVARPNRMGYEYLFMESEIVGTRARRRQRQTAPRPTSPGGVGRAGMKA
jgi:hypothetical protein